MVILKVVAWRVKRLPAKWETQLRSLGWEDSLEKELAAHSCLGNPMGGEAWWATFHGVAKSQTQLSDFTFTFILINTEKALIKSNIYSDKSSQ